MTISRWARRLPLVMLVASSTRCVEFANVHVSVKDPAGGPIARAQIYSGRSGEFLDVNNADMPLRKLRFAPAPTLSLVVRNDCRIIGWQVVQVEKWAPTPLAARDATQTNNVLFVVDPKQAACN